MRRPIISAVIVLVLAVGLAYAAGRSVGTSAPQELQAHRFELVDREGRVRALLTTTAQGESYLQFTDREGKVRAIFGVSAKGEPQLQLLDQAGAVRSVLVQGEQDGAMLQLNDDKGTSRLLLAAYARGGSALTLNDAKKQRRAMLAVGPDEVPALGLWDNEGRVCADMSVDAAGKPSISFISRDKVMWSAPPAGGEGK